MAEVGTEGRASRGNYPDAPTMEHPLVRRPAVPGQGQSGQGQSGHGQSGQGGQGGQGQGRSGQGQSGQSHLGQGTVTPPPQQPRHQVATGGGPLGMPPAPDEALNVLATAERAAADHVAAAGRAAEQVRDHARVAADRLARDAEAHAAGLRQEADRTLSQARTAMEEAAAEAGRRTGEAQREAERILDAARLRARGIAENARAQVTETDLKARRRYDDSVGSLHARKEELEQRIEALRRFDGAHREQLTAYVENRLHTLRPDLGPAEKSR